MSDGGFSEYLSSVDCMIMGRRCMEKIASFNLPEDQWPYGELPIHVLSRSLKEAPANLRARIELYDGAVRDLVAKLESAGHRHVYVDGGATITSFLAEGLLDEICITQVPVLLGEGIPLFGKLPVSLKLAQAEAVAYANDFVQLRYRVIYS